MTYGTTGGRDGHSVIEALEQAQAAGQAGAVATVMVLPMFNPSGPGVKVIGRDQAGRNTYYSEVPVADLGRLLAAFGEVNEITDLVGILQADGMALADATDVAGALRPGQLGARSSAGRESAR